MEKLVKLTEEQIEDKLIQHELWLNTDGRKGCQADFSNTDLQEVDFSNRDLRSINFCGSNLERTIFAQSDLSEAILEEANLKFAILSNADLSYTDLTHANLKSAELGETKLCGATLENAILEKADLSFADLSDADLTGANLENTCLYRTIFLCTKVDDMINVGNLGKHNRTAYYFYKSNRVVCGCFDSTLEEFEKMVEERYSKDSNYYNAIKMFKSFRK